MKRLISILVAIVFISSVFSSVMAVSPSEQTCVQETFVDYDALVTGNIFGGLDSTNNSSINSSQEYSVYPIFEKRRYESDERISVRFELTESLVGTISTYECDGFSVAGEVTSGWNKDTESQYYDVTLSYDEFSEYPYFSFNVATNAGVTVCAEVYGYLSDAGLFISDSSFDAAKDCSYYYLVETGVWTMEEYNAVLEWEYSQYGTETSSETVQLNTTSAIVGSTMSISEETTVSGNLGWVDDVNVWHPMQHNMVEVWDARYAEQLGTVYTDVSGNYEFIFADECSYRDIYVKIYPGGRNAMVKTGNGGTYVYTSGIRLNVTPGSSISIGLEIDMSSDLGKAFQISQAVNVATEYVKQMNGQYITSVGVTYPHANANKTGCYYEVATRTIHIKKTTVTAYGVCSYSSWDSIMHEYGHHIQKEFDIARHVGGTHNLVGNLAELNGNENTGENKYKGVYLAWAEAYPSVFGGMAQAYYASTLQNIVAVGDAKYQAYNNAQLDYETPEKDSRFDPSEACEGAVIAILWDLYDNEEETHDTISFSHQNYWDLITNCDAETFSEFCNYFISRYDASKDFALGKLLSYYKMSPTDVTADVSGATPIFSWTANGTSDTLQNDRFDLIVFNRNRSETLRVEDITTTSYTLSEEEWQTVLLSYGTSYYVIVVAHQTSTPVTGGYYSAPLSIAKPINNESSSIAQNTWGRTRYSEKVITLTPGTYYDLYVTFGTTGSQLIQTFGRKDTTMELYSASGELLVGRNETDDNGFRFNDLLRYDTLEDTQYIIRVRLWDSQSSGTIKVAITPARGACAPNVESIECYEDIQSFEGSSTLTWSTSLELNHSGVITFTPPETGDYTFETISDLDTVLYVLDPRSPNAVVRFVDYNDNGGADLNAKLTKTLEAGISYFVIYCGHDVEDANNIGDLILSITANDSVS